MKCEICGKELESRKSVTINGIVFCNKHGNVFEMLNGNLEETKAWYEENK